MRTIIQCALAAAICLFGHATQAKEVVPFVPVEVTMQDQSRHQYNFVDSRVQLTTGLGKFEFWLHDLTCIERQPTQGLYRVETSHGDTRMARLVLDQFRYYYLDAVQPMSLAAFPFQKLEVKDPTGHQWTPQEHARLLLKDGSQVCLDPGNWTLDVRNDAGEWSLPIGSLRTMKVVFSPQSQSSSVAVRFPCGQIEQFHLIGRQTYLHATDTYGNRFRVYFDDARGMSGRIGIEDHPLSTTSVLDRATSTDGGVATSGTNADPAHRVDVTSVDGRTQMFTWPLIVWTLKGSLGPVFLPTASIAEIATYGKGQLPRVTTLYGEHLVGAVEPSRIDVPVPTRPGQYVPLIVDRQRSLRFNRPRFAPPDGWLAWRLSSGDIFLARFAEDNLKLKPSDANDTTTQLPTRSIVSVVKQGDVFTIVTDRDPMQTARPASRSTRIVLLTNGMVHELPWGCVESISHGAPADPRLPLPAMAAQEAVAAVGSGGVDSKRWFARILGPDESTRALSFPDRSVLVCGDTFIMGRTQGEGMADEMPPHAVTLSSFYMDPHEITRAQFAEFVNSAGYKTDAEKSGATETWRNPGFAQRADEPVVCVSWNDAARFCIWRSRQAGFAACYEFKGRSSEVVCYPDRNGYRLPTEAEWEYAARGGGADVLFPWGDTSVISNAIAAANFKQKPDEPRDPYLWTSPVEAFRPNNIGLFGMAGNVWEWCDDWYFDDAYASIHRQRQRDPCVRSGDVAGLTRKAMRGGSFANELDMLRCACRGSGLPSASAPRVGFRCVRKVERSD